MEQVTDPHEQIFQNRIEHLGRHDLPCSCQSRCHLPPQRHGDYHYYLETAEKSDKLQAINNYAEAYSFTDSPSKPRKRPRTASKNISAIIVHHRDAKYYTLGESRVEQLMK